MVVKTDICAYTEYKIYPGKGQRFVAKDGKTHLFINKKADSLFHQRIKPVKLTWTQAWRRKNKKGKIEDSNKRKKAKVQKFQKAIVGMSLDDLKRKKGQKPSEGRHHHLRSNHLMVSLTQPLLLSREDSSPMRAPAWGQTEFRQQAKEQAAKEAKARQQKAAANRKKVEKSAAAASTKAAPAKKVQAAKAGKSSKQKK